MYIYIFSFLFVKIITREQLCQQLVKSVICICFRFSACKNRDTGIAILAAGYTVCTYVLSLFQSRKLYYRGNSYIKLVVHICFGFSAYKNCNKRATILVADQVICTYIFSFFWLQKSQRKSSYYVNLIINTCFWFSTGKNCNLKTAILALITIFYIKIMIKL